MFSVKRPRKQLFDKSDKTPSAVILNFDVIICRTDKCYYAIRQKRQNYTYYIRIDVYGKAKKKYYVSVYHPIRFSLLSVHHLSFQVDISS
jgi:hypothetical protein